MLEIVLAALLTALVVATLSNQDAGPGQVVLGILTVAPLAFVLYAPILSTVLMMGSVLAYALLDFGAVAIGGNGIIFGFFAVVVTCSTRWSLVLFPFALADVAAVYLTAGTALTWQEAVRAALTLAVGWTLGIALKRWIERSKRIAVAAAEAAAGERLRIAREMHDFIAHHLSAVTLQSGVAKMVASSDPAAALRAMDAVAVAGHEALEEMRHLLGVLRAEDDSRPGGQRQWGIRDVPGLVDRMRELGLDVGLTVTGTAWPMTEAQQLCAYRVLQESLTNVLKHAGAVRTSVTVDYRPHEVRISVANEPGDRVPARPDATSFGIRGMRERAEACGATVEAGPAGDGGFRVDLTIAGPAYPDSGTRRYLSRETTT